MVHEGGIALLVALGQRHPGLDAEQLLPRALALGGGALGVDDAASRAHPVYRARLDGDVGAQRVPVVDLPLEQVGQRGKVDMRVRTHVNALIGQELGRAHLVEEDEGADHLALGGGQRTAHRHLAQIDRARDDQGLNGIDARGIAGHGVGAGGPGHEGGSFGSVRAWGARQC